MNSRHIKKGPGLPPRTLRNPITLQSKESSAMDFNNHSPDETRVAPTHLKASQTELNELFNQTLPEGMKLALDHLPMASTESHYISTRSHDLSTRSHDLSTRRLIWSDERTGAQVYVQGGMVHITHGAMGSYVLTPDEAAAFADAFANAVVHACARASRWNSATRRQDGGTA